MSLEGRDFVAPEVVHGLSSHLIVEAPRAHRSLGDHDLVTQKKARCPALSSVVISATKAAHAGQLLILKGVPTLIGNGFLRRRAVPVATSSLLRILEDETLPLDERKLHPLLKGGDIALSHWARCPRFAVRRFERCVKVRQ